MCIYRSMKTAPRDGRTIIIRDQNYVEHRARWSELLGCWDSEDNLLFDSEAKMWRPTVSAESKQIAVFVFVVMALFAALSSCEHSGREGRSAGALDGVLIPSKP